VSGFEEKEQKGFTEDQTSAAAKARFKYLTETPVPNLIGRLAVPTIISMLVTAIYNTADTYFVGKVSTEAISAVGVAFSAMAIIQAFGFFCGQGSGNFLSRMLGAGKRRDAEEMAATGLALSGIIGVVVAALVIAYIEPVAYFIGAKEDFVAETISYVRIIMFGAPFMMAQFVLNNQLRYQGSAIYAMAGLLCGAILNIGLDPLLILVFDMGVSGAAIATVCGQIISFFVLLIGTTKGANIRLNLKNIRFTPHYLIEIVNGGIPALFRQGLAAVATLLLNRAAGEYGDAAIAGMTVTTKVTMFMASAIIGFGQGYQPVCSFNYGAGKKDRVREGYFFCVKWGTAVLLVLSALCFVFSPQIIWFFRQDPEVVEVGKVALKWQAAALPLFACSCTTNMMLQSIGKGVKASITASARSGLFFIPLILILPRVFGLAGVEAAQAVADILTISICIPLAASELRKMKGGYGNGPLKE
jgi:putative MATE family efflux protein